MTFVHDVACFQPGAFLSIELYLKVQYLLEYSNPKQPPFSSFAAQLRQSEAQSVRLLLEEGESFSSVSDGQLEDLMDT